MHKGKTTHLEEVLINIQDNTASAVALYVR